MVRLIKILKSGGIGRNFFIYLFISLILIFTITFVLQWYATSWFVQRHEYERITSNLVRIKNALKEQQTSHIDNMNKLRDIFILYHNKNNELDKILDENLYSQSMFYILNSNKQIVYGYEWESFLDKIRYLKNPEPFFVFVDGLSLYKVAYERITDLSDTEIYYIYFISALTDPQIPQIPFKSYPYEHLKSSPDRLLRFINNKIITQDEKSQIMVFPYDNISSYGVLIQNDLNDEPAIIYTYQYPREVYMFFRRFTLLILFIIISSLFLLSIISTTIISNKIFKPLWLLIEKMKKISENPNRISDFNLKTHGEILQIYDYFNNMSIAVNEYQKELNKTNELLNKIDAGIFWLDENMQIIHHNKALTKILKNNDLKDTNIWSVFQCKKTEFINNKLEINPYEIDALDKQVSLTIYSFVENFQTKYFGIVYDITEELKQSKIRRTLEIELIRINRLGELGRRVQGIIHNLNTPLNSVIGFAQLLHEDHPEDRDLQKIIASAKSMSLIIKQLLQKTKDDSIAMPMLVNLNHLLSQELSFCSHDLFFKHNVELQLNFADDIPDTNMVYGDISQVFQTMFNNAIEAMLETDKKILTITSFTQDSMIAFSVKDTGTGIDNDTLDKIFEPSFSTKTLTDKSGFGLGLPLSKAIIDKINGKIEIKTQLGEGSEFIVYIPSNV